MLTITSIDQEFLSSLIQDKIISIIDAFPPENRTGEMGAEVFHTLRAIIKASMKNPTVTVSNCNFYADKMEGKIKRNSQPLNSESIKDGGNNEKKARKTQNRG